MVFIFPMSEATKWIMHVLSPYDTLTPLQYLNNVLGVVPS